MTQIDHDVPDDDIAGKLAELREQIDGPEGGS